MSASLLQRAKAWPRHSVPLSTVTVAAAPRAAGAFSAPDAAGTPGFWMLATAGAMLIGLVGYGAHVPLPAMALAVLAVAGGFFLAALALGEVHFGATLPGEGLTGPLLEGLDEGLMVTGRGAKVLYANAAARSLLAQGGAPPAPGGAGSLDGFLASTPAAAEAIYRLRRAAGASEARVEEFGIPAESLQANGCDEVELAERRLQVSVVPMAPSSSRSALSPTAVWRLRDVTVERARESDALGALQATLAVYDQLPVGVAVADCDGLVIAANARLREDLGYGARAAAAGGLSLKDMLSADALHLVAAQASQGGGALAVLDLDIRGADQRLHPVQLLARDIEASGLPGAGGGAVRVIAFTDHPADGAQEAHGDAAEERFSRLFQSAPFGIATIGADGRILSANAAFARLGLNGTGGLQQLAADVLVPAGDAETRRAVETALRTAIDRRSNSAPVEIALGARREYVRRLFFHPALRSAGTAVAAILYLVDATDEKALEAKFAQSQKMEAVGKLVGGIAHDFNNMLTAIIGYSDILLQTHRPTDPAHADIMSIRNSADRAASFVGKLLTLSRQRTLNVEPILLDELVTDLAPLLNRSIGETIDLRIQNGRDLWHVRTDKGEIEQAIINLAVNARDAMSGRGRLTLRTRNVTERETRKLGLEGMIVGEYVALEVEDTGTGMTPEVQAKIFEPFFTTKAVGKGTGLGLAAVMGMVKQSGGYIYADSTLGQGTTFRIYLPRVHVEAEEEEAAAAAKAQKAKERQPVDITGTGRVLLVEDEDVVRAFAVRALRSRGYDVLEASDGREALEVMAAAGGKVDIVVSDVVMPEMDGPTLLKALRAQNPDLKIIFVSGYPNEAFKASLDEGEEFAFLAKPFSLPQLAAKVKEELGK